MSNAHLRSANASSVSAQVNKKTLDKSAIAKIAQRREGFRVNVHDIKQKPLLDMALELVREKVIAQTTRLGSTAVYHSVITHENVASIRGQSL